MEGLSSLWALLTQVANSDMGKYLPISPFQRFIASYEGFATIQQYLKYVNWFIPVGILLDIMTIWLGVIAIFYGGQAVLRWLNIID